MLIQRPDVKALNASPQPLLQHGHIERVVRICYGEGVCTCMTYFHTFRLNSVSAGDRRIVCKLALLLLLLQLRTKVIVAYCAACPSPKDATHSCNPLRSAAGICAPLQDIDPSVFGYLP